MNLKLEHLGAQSIVYDADRIRQPHPRLFDPAWWQGRGQVVGTASGRGDVLLLDGVLGPAVLRRYLRGGWAARVSHDRYVYTGTQRSRPFREVQLLARLEARSLPVARPLAGLCDRRGLVYRGALLMQRILPAEPLAELISALPAMHPAWPAIGRCIRRFHDADVVHADLNARNILVQPEATIYLIDFDRARISHRSMPRPRAGLQRLARSLRKCWPVELAEQFEPCWKKLIQGYNAAL